MDKQVMVRPLTVSVVSPVVRWLVGWLVGLNFNPKPKPFMVDMTYFVIIFNLKCCFLGLFISL